MSAPSSARWRGCGRWAGCWSSVRARVARVSVLALDLERIMLDTRAAWGNIGEDYILRVGGEAAAETAPSTVVPFRRPDVPVAGQGVWGRAQALLAAEDRPLYDALDRLSGGWRSCMRAVRS